MSTAAPPITAEDLLAMPDDGVERWIINGELREGGMTIRNYWHSETEALVVIALGAWLRTQPRPRGKVLVGEAGVRLRTDPEVTVGVDVAYLSPDRAQTEPAESTILEGAPTVAIEILSPSDKQEDVDDKIETYLAAGVRQVWLLHPRRRTVIVCRADRPEVMYNADQELTGDPDLPGFRVPVRGFFEDIAP